MGIGGGQQRGREAGIGQIKNNGGSAPRGRGGGGFSRVFFKNPASQGAQQNKQIDGARGGGGHGCHHRSG